MTGSGHIAFTVSKQGAVEIFAEAALSLVLSAGPQPMERRHPYSSHPDHPNLDTLTGVP